MKKALLFSFIFILLSSYAYAEQVHAIGITDIKYNGALGGLAGADVKCQQWASSHGLSGTWKALIGANGRHVNLNWVLVPDTPYYEIDGQTIVAYTNSNGCFAFLPITVWAFIASP